MVLLLGEDYGRVCREATYGDVVSVRFPWLRQMRGWRDGGWSVLGGVVELWGEHSTIL